MGIQHIPHTEDIPVTTTTGLDLQFFIMPFNYFEEDPALGSRDAIRIDPRDSKHESQGVTVERYGRPETFNCLPRQYSFTELLKSKPSSLFDFGESNDL